MNQWLDSDSLEELFYYDEQPTILKDEQRTNEDGSITTATFTVPAEIEAFVSLPPRGILNGQLAMYLHLEGRYFAGLQYS